MDPTLRRVKGFAQRDRFGGMIIANAFALVSTDPAGLTTSLVHSVGPENDEHLALLPSLATKIVLGYGAVPDFDWRFRAVRKMFPDAHCWGLTKEGYPRHPLYLKATTPLVPFVTSVP